MATSRLEIDLSAVERNLGVVRGVLGAEGGDATRHKSAKGSARTAVCAVVKQDGYGLGAVRLAKKLVGGSGSADRLGRGDGVEMLAVYGLDEARALAEAIANVPILILMPVTTIDRMDPLYRHLSSGRIHLTLHSEDQFRQIAEMSVRIGATVPMHVQVDTGLSRGGAMPEQAQRLVEKVVSTPRSKLAGLMTHFASPCCDAEFTREQARLFRDFVEGVKPVLKAAVATGAKSGNSGLVAPSELMLHAANSCAIFRARSYHGTMARVGQALLGFALEDPPETENFEFREQARALEPCVRWTTTVAHVSEIPGGWPVGYGSTWRAPWRGDGKKTRVALIPVGYADGYARALGGKAGGGPGFVAFTGRAWEKKSGGEPEESIESARTRTVEGGGTVYAPVVGRVSMDQITVDVTDVPEAYLAGAGRMEGGPEVELFGRDRSVPNFISTMAARSGSITHEQLCRVSARVERVYRYPAVAAGGGTTGTPHEHSGVVRPLSASGAEDPGRGSHAPQAAIGMAAFSTAPRPS